jgi:hypothetical protein
MSHAGNRPMRLVLTACVILVLLAGVLWLERYQPRATDNLPAAGSYARLASFRGHGELTASAIGPGLGTDRDHRFLYLSYSYTYLPFDLVAVDLVTGSYQVFASPIASEIAANALSIGSDGELYLRTTPDAYLLRFDLQTREPVEKRALIAVRKPILFAR